MVETAGDQLTGRYEQTVLEPSGQIKQIIASITGASDGHTVVVTIKPTELLSGASQRQVRSKDRCFTYLEAVAG